MYYMYFSSGTFYFRKKSSTSLDSALYVQTNQTPWAESRDVEVPEEEKKVPDAKYI